MRHLHPLRDAAYAQQIHHHDVDGSRLQHVPERLDAVVVLACRYRRIESVRDARQPRVVLEVRRILQPEQAVLGHPAPHSDGTVHVPALIDVHHQIDAITHRLAHHTQPCELVRCGLLRAHAELHRREALSREVARGRGKRVEVVVTPQETARIRGHDAGACAQQLPHGHTHGLPLDVPQRHVDGRYGPRNQSRGRTPARPSQKARADLLRAERVRANGRSRERIHHLFQRLRHQRRGEPRIGDALDAVVSAQRKRYVVRLLTRRGWPRLARDTDSPRFERCDSHDAHSPQALNVLCQPMNRPYATP